MSDDIPEFTICDECGREFPFEDSYTDDDGDVLCPDCHIDKEPTHAP